MCKGTKRSRWFGWKKVAFNTNRCSTGKAKSTRILPEHFEVSQTLQTTVLSIGENLDSSSVTSLKSDQKKGVIPLAVQLATKVKVKIGGLKTSSFMIRVKCGGLKSNVQKGKTLATLSSSSDTSCDVKGGEEDPETSGEEELAEKKTRGEEDLWEEITKKPIGGEVNLDKNQ
ncbi:hypothetical protein NE237_024520 [Protea cynaroides]|uniref:Uncharacterized protein n=1 Tax=Protea cynaroides TaxID=273540 RepID=A0A9Q0JYM5_9MAGN|nr:hypothetical protein NE237_024520 [Protea cynaroides]